MKRLFEAAITLSLITGTSLAQGAEPQTPAAKETTKAEAAEVTEVTTGTTSRSVTVISKDGKTYRKVVENGKVIEESGDASLAESVDVSAQIRTVEEVDIDAIVQEAMRTAGKPQVRVGSPQIKSRIIVMEDGETVIDRESGGLDFGGIDLPKGVVKMIEAKVGSGSERGRLGLDRLVERAKRAAGDAANSASTRVVVVKNGETIVDDVSGDAGGAKMEIDIDVESLDLPAEAKQALERAMETRNNRLPRPLRVTKREPLKPRRAQESNVRGGKEGSTKSSSSKRGNSSKLEAKIERLQRKIERLERRLHRGGDSHN
ncbi:MAG: hypothetical protein AB8H80_01440 [Planctomycetota bacterium]